MDKTSLGDRMKGYEGVASATLIRRMPVIMRIDGKAFHTWTKGITEPFDENLKNLFVKTTESFVGDAQNAVFAYHQSDEVSVFFKDWETFETDAWFSNKIQKMTSVGASMFTAYFNEYRKDFGLSDKKVAMFDCRVFNLPKEEVVNYFIWRQQDMTRNSVQMLARQYFSHKQLDGVSNERAQDMLMIQKEVNWNDLDVWKKRGSCVYRPLFESEGRLTDDRSPPIFTQDRGYIDRFLT